MEPLVVMALTCSVCFGAPSLSVLVPYISAKSTFSQEVKTKAQRHAAKMDNSTFFIVG